MVNKSISTLSNLIVGYKNKINLLNMGFIFFIIPESIKILNNPFHNIITSPISIISLIELSNELIIVIPNKLKSGDTIGVVAPSSPIIGENIEELEEAKKRAAENRVNICFEHADFCALSEYFSRQFDVVICMDNALPHMLSEQAMETAVRSIVKQILPGGMFIASIRDYDAILRDKPPYSPPYIHKTEKGQRVSFQTWQWEDDRYKLTQYIIDDEETLQISKFSCEYRATLREELTKLLLANGCREVVWKFPDETGFYQPIVLAKK